MANQDGQVIYRVVIDDSQVDSDMRRAEGQVESSSKGLKDKAKAGAKAIGIGLGAAVLGIGTMAVKAADDMDKAMNQFIASTGKGADEAEKYQGVLESIYTNNYGESFQDIAEKMGLVNQQMGDLSDEELKRVTEQAYLLQDTFEIDFSESIRGVNSLVKQFGITSDEAFNLLAQGAQQGLNQNGDLADQLAEYSVYYSDMGFSAEQAFNMMSAGAKDGAFQLDYLNDAIKEFGIRSKDGSKASSEAFQALGLDAEEYFNAFAKGGETANEAFGEVTSLLSQVQDPLQKNAIGVALFGTKFEDLGESAVDALSGMNGTIDSSVDKLGEMENIKYGSTSEMLEGLKRSVEPLLVELGQGLIPIIKSVIEALMPVVQKILPILSNLLLSLIPPIGELIEALLPVIVELFELLAPAIIEIVEMAMPVLIDLIKNLVPLLVDIIHLLKPIIELFLGILAPIMALIGEGLTPLIAILAELISKYLSLVMIYLELLQATFEDVFKSIAGYVTDQVKRLTNIFSNLIDFIKNVFTGNFKGAFENIKNIFTSIWEGIVAGFKLPFNVIISGLNSFFGKLSGIKIPDWVPKFGGKSFNLGVKIPKLAKGGIATGPSLAMVGDNPNASIDPEVIAPLSKLKSMLGMSLSAGGQRIVYNNVVVKDNVIDSRNIDSIGNDFMNKLKREGNY